MCGICGFIGEDDKGAEILKEMTDVIVHRGPDSDGIYTENGIFMGFRRLSIIDIEESGSQPIYNEDKTLVLTFNGEIYNYMELKEELLSLGHVFYTQTDSEVLVHGYEQWGTELLDRLRGMFGFAIYNTQTNEFFMARDFFGIKPLYYTTADGCFVYGSEIKSILKFPGYEKKLNENALNNYLSFQYSVPDQTFFEGIYCLPPAHYLLYKDGEITISRYWTPDFKADEKTLEQATDEIDEVFTKSVEAHRIADVPVGCFLSSGVDSSYVASFFGGEKAFTVGFAYDQYNEISYAQEFSKQANLDHTYKIISDEEYWNSIPLIQYHMDQPHADPSCIALYFVSKIAREHVKVVLSGEGADELFGGYNIYHEPLSLKSFQKIPKFLRKFMAMCVSPLPFFKGKSFIIRASKNLEERFIGNANMFSKKEKQKLLKNPALATAPQEITKPFYDKIKRYDDITKMQYIDIHLWMVGDILLKADRMSMANSLELRVPFLDKEVFKTAASLKTEYRCNNIDTKYAMRLAAKRHIPQSTAEKKKLGFPVPTRVWLRQEKYYNIIKEAFDSPVCDRYFNKQILMKYLDRHYNGKEDNSRKIWTIYIFIVWYNQFFEA